jgi:uncharacterized membrane protein
MANWEPHGKIAQAQAGAGAVTQAGAGTCVECGRIFPSQDMVAYEGSLVCAACKPLFFQRIQEGAASLGNTANRDLMAKARACLSGNWGLAIGVLLVYMVINVVTSFIPFGLGSIISLLISGPLAVGLCVFFFALVRSGSPEFSMMFEGFKNFGTALGAYILMGVFVFLWSLPMIVCIIAGVVAMISKHESMGVVFFVLMAPAMIPAMIAQYAYSMTLFVVADDSSVGPLEAVRRSVKMMRGRKWKLFCLYLRFMGWAILCVFTLLIGFLWLAPYMYASTTLFYDDVKGRAVAA